uniref:Gamma-sarcoglycan n=1 Tax=Caenorhabditis japonica TaxID=281687 RepID=A0A8R1E3U4_CAEJA
MRGYPVYAINNTDEPVWSRNDRSMSRGVSHPTMMQPATSAYAGGAYTTYPAPQNTVIHSTVKPVADADIYRVGIYGWRKRFLYIFILILTIGIVLNLALTFWIMSVLDFSSDGIGALKIEDDGIRVEGRAQFDRPVHFSKLSTLDEETLTIDSFRGVNLQARNSHGDVASKFSLMPEGKAQVTCDRFEIFDEDQKLLFFADSDEIGLKLENLRILDEGGSVFEGAIQTSSIRPQPDSPLRLESPTRSVSIDAAQDIEVLAAAGEVSINSLLDISIASKQTNRRRDSGKPID